MVLSFRELVEKCNAWQSEDDVGFASIVSSYLQISGAAGERKLANEFEAAVSTVSRWAKGLARPLPRMQVEVVDWIKNHLSTEES